MKKTKKKVARKKSTGSKAVKKPAKPRTKASGVEAVSVGGRVPELTLPATGNKSVALGTRGKAMVLYFYPKDSTPGCTLEGRDFSRLLREFSAAGAEVFGVSRDSMASHERFKEKECYQMDLLSDADEVLCNTFGVIKKKNMYGRQVRGIERSTFVIDKDGRLVKEWRGVKVTGHADEVLEYVRSL